MIYRATSLVSACFILLTGLRFLSGQERPASSPPPARALIESPLRSVVRDRSGALPGVPVGFVNPKVAPGLIRWHTDFTAACEASRKSGKPVLLFHLLGRLDERFC